MTFGKRVAIVGLAIVGLIFAQPIWNGAMFLGDQIADTIQYTQGYAQQTPSHDRGNDGINVDIGPKSNEEGEFDLSVRFRSDDAQLRFEGDEDGGSLSLQADGQVWDKWRGKAVDFLQSLGFNISVTR